MLRPFARKTMRLGFTVQTAKNGAQALPKIRGGSHGVELAGLLKRRIF